MADVDILDVRLHGESIGTLTRLGHDRIVFGFDPAYIDDPRRATLGLAFRDAFGDLVTDIPATRTWAHPFFSNLLPEGPLREYLARAAGLDPRAEFQLLAALGEDLPGAVTVVPVEAVRTASASGDGSRFAGAGRFVGAGSPGRGGHDGAQATPDAAAGGLLRSPPPLRFSLAGVQLKLSATMTAGRLTVPVHGVGGSWIVKLPSPAFPGLCEQEFAMMRLAAAVGIDVPEVRLVSADLIGNLPRGVRTGPGPALAVRRFDRSDDGVRVHIEDFAQVLGAYPEQKYLAAGYREIAEVVGREIGDDAVIEFVHRLVFCALIGNGDAHLKNWSLIYPDDRNPQLAPAYDLVSTIAYADDDRMALRWLGEARRFTDLSEDLLARLASGARLPQRLVVRAGCELVERFLAVWERDRENLGVPCESVAAIERNLGQVLSAGALPTTPR